MKKFLALLLALCMVLSMTACGAKTEAPAATEATEAPFTWSDPYADLRGGDNYDELSAAIYADVLGEFYDTYQAALMATNVSERYALMALAEGKLMGSGVFVPLTSNGGNYAISAAAPYTACSVLWGKDSDRYHNMLVATEPLLAADRDELKAMWAELKGTGTWEAEAKKFLEEKGYELQDTYTIGYSSDPKVWDVLTTSRSADSEALVNLYDGLMEYNSENVLSPALAESYEVSEDGLTYTFKLRSGVKWVDSQGREVADVKADDFVAGMQHVMDDTEGLSWLLEGVVVNATEYISGEVTDFTQVGVKAVDDLTVEYTLVQPTSYFMTMLGYGVFAPMSRSYYESKGGKFGADYDNTAASYTYAKTPNDIAYCGPYTVANLTAENTIVFQANPAYWNADNITIKTLTWLYNDGEDALKAYNDVKAGVLDGAGLNASAAEAAKSDGLFDTLAYISSTDATSFVGFHNVNRTATANFNDGAMPTTKNQTELIRTSAAMLNQHFRLAMCQGFDRATYNAQVVGEDLKLTSIINSYTPGTFVSLEEDVTVYVNGTETTFPAGTAYGAIMQAQLDADGIALKVWDPEADGGVGSSTQFDGWYNAEAAAAELELAIAELAPLGIEVSPENPIYIDYAYFAGSESYSNRAQAYKKSIETSLNGCVVILLNDCADSQEWYYASYYPNFGYEYNCDMTDNSGWGPDYGDPQSYLNTMLPDYEGYMVKALGIF